MSTRLFPRVLSLLVALAACGDKTAGPTTADASVDAAANLAQVVFRVHAPDTTPASGLFLTAAFWNDTHRRDPADPARDANSHPAAKNCPQRAKDIGVEDPRANKLLDEILGS